MGDHGSDHADTEFHTVPGRLNGPSRICDAGLQDGDVITAIVREPGPVMESYRKARPCALSTVPVQHPGGEIAILESLTIDSLWHHQLGSHRTISLFVDCAHDTRGSCSVPVAQVTVKSGLRNDPATDFKALVLAARLGLSQPSKMTLW